MKRNSFLFSMLLLCTFQLSAQLQASWEGKAGSAIQWNAFSPDGNLICGTEGGKTVALQPQTGEIIWEKSYEKGVFSVLPNTSYIYWQNSDNDLFVVDPVNGKSVCDSKKLGVSDLESFYPVREGNGLVLYTRMNDLEQVWMVNLADGALRWKREFDFSKKLKTPKIGGLSLDVKMAEDTTKMQLHCAPIGDGSGGVFISFHQRIMNLSSSGETNWDIEFPSQFGNQKGFFKASGVDFHNIIPDQSGEFLYVFSGAYMSCHRRSNGEMAWENPVKVYAPVKNIIYEKEQMTLVPAPKTATQKAYINCVDYETGATKFGDKELQVKGGFVQSAFCSKGIVFITKALVNDTHFFNIINQETGEFELDKPLKIFEGPYQIAEVNGGILFSSEHGVNLYDFKTREMVIDKQLKVSGDDKLCRLDVEGKSYLYSSSKNNIFILDHSDLSVSKFNKEELALKGGDKAEGFTRFQDGLVLHSAQNIIKFDWNGNLMFHKYYKAPGAGGWQIVKASLGAIGGLAQMAAAAATSVAVTELDNQMDQGLAAMNEEAATQLTEGEMTAEEYAQYTSDSKELSESMDALREETNEQMAECAAMGFTNTLAASVEIARVAGRFKNSKATKNYVVLMTDDKEQGGIGLAVVSKIDGEIKLFIPMKQSRTGTSYSIDPATNYLYWIPTIDSNVKSKKYPNIDAMQQAGTVIAYNMNKL